MPFMGDTLRTQYYTELQAQQEEERRRQEEEARRQEEQRRQEEEARRQEELRQQEEARQKQLAETEQRKAEARRLREQQMQNDTAQQQLASQQEAAAAQRPEDQRWYKGDLPTQAEAFGLIVKTGETDPARAKELRALLYQHTQEADSIFYNPYLNATNPAIANLQAMGLDVGEINDEWFEQNAWAKAYYHTTGNTNNASAPGKNASPQELFAYQYNQLLKAEEQTKQAEMESKALQEELTYWAQQGDRNYSDEEIMNRIDWKKYPTLFKMQESRNEGTPIELNRAVPGWNDDWMKGVLWAARNDGGTGNNYYDQAQWANGVGNRWQENKDIADRLNFGSANYAPYTVGSTMEKERLFYGVTSFDDQWLQEHKPGPDASQEEINAWNKVKKAEDFTKACEAELKDLNAEIDLLTKNGGDPEEIFNKLQVKLYDKDYANLRKLQDSMEYAGDEALLDTTRAIGYNLNDFRKQIEEKCAEAQTKLDAYDMLKKNAVCYVPGQVKESLVHQNKNIQEAEELVQKGGIPAEQNQFNYGGSSVFNFVTENLRKAQSGAIFKMISNSMQPNSIQYANDMIPTLLAADENRRATEALSEINGQIAAFMQKKAETLGATAEEISAMDTLRGSDDERLNRNLETIQNGNPEDRGDALIDLYRQISGNEEYGNYSDDRDDIIVKAYDWYNYITGYDEQARGLNDADNAAMMELQQQAAEQQAIIDRTEGAQDKVIEMQEKNQHLIEFYERCGIDTTEMRMASATAEALMAFNDYEATRWNSFNEYDMMMQRMDSTGSFSTVMKEAKAFNASNEQLLQTAKTMLQYIEDNKIEATDAQINNLKRYIGKLERSATDYEWFAYRGEKDFDELAAKGEAKFNEDVDNAKEGFYSIEGYKYQDLMTESEKKTYYYLYEQYGLDKANRYLDYLSDGTYGVMPTRYAENQRQYAANEVNSGFLGGLWANAKALISAPLEGLNGLAYMIEGLVTGKERNPDHPLLALSAFSESTYSESTQAIKRGLKDSGIDENSVLGQVALGAYEIFYNHGRSLVNGMVTGGITSGISNPVLQELAGASLMAFGAGAQAAAAAKKKGAEDWQAYLIGAVTTIMEDVTEGLTYGNLQEALHGATESGAEGLKKLLAKWLKEDGVEEMCGESITDIVEKIADTKVLGLLSDHQEAFDDYRAKNPDWTDQQIEEAILRDEVSDLLHTAIISYISPSTNVAISELRSLSEDYHNIRALTKEAQQKGFGTNMVQMAKVYSKLKAEAAQEADAQSKPKSVFEAKREEEAAQKAAQKQAAIEEYNQKQASQKEASAAAPVQLSESDQQLLHTLGVLSVGRESNTATRAAGIASVLGGEQNTNRGDMSKAAATNGAQLFGGLEAFESEVQTLMLGADRAGVDGNLVRDAVVTATLSESSQARSIVTSEEYKTMPAQKKVRLLADSIAMDAGNQTVTNEVSTATHEARVAEVEVSLVANGEIQSVEDAKTKLASLEQANMTLAMAEKSLKEKQDARQAKFDALNIAVNEAINRPTAENNHANTAALNEYQSALAVEEEYEQHLEKINTAQANAQQEATAAQERALNDLRAEAERVVQDQNAQREARDAQLAEQQRQQQEAASKQAAEQAQKQAEAKAAEDERTGKAQEDQENAKIEMELNNEKIRDTEQREKRLQALKDQRDKVKFSKVNLGGPVNNTEGMLAVGAFGRKLGLNIELSDDMPFGVRGKYKDGVVYLNNKRIVNGSMSVGQALVEASLHEITHAMENTGAYKLYKNIVLDKMFGDKNATYDTNAMLRAAVDDKIKQYKNDIDKDLTPDQATAEIVADFARKNLAEKDVIQRFMDAGVGGKMRNALHNVNQAMRNFFSKMTGEERTEAEYLRRAERAYQKAMNQVAREDIHPDGDQFSVQQMAEATKMGMVYVDDGVRLFMPDENGTIVGDGKNGMENGVRYSEIDGVNVRIEPEMIVNTPVGMLIDMGLSDDVVTDKDGKTQYDENGNARTQKGDARKMFADLMNLCARYKDNNLIWEIAGSEFSESFSALKSNSDPQYRNTVDFGTICSKTQAIVDVLSQTMLDRIEVLNKWNEEHKNDEGFKPKVFTGLTRDDIMGVYDRTHEAGLSVPCPVCYVFSRWMGVPGMLGQINRFQHEYVTTEKDANGNTVYNENGDAKIDWAKTGEDVNKYLREMVKEYSGVDILDTRLTAEDRKKAIKAAKDKIADKKNSIKDKIRNREENRPKLYEQLGLLNEKLEDKTLKPRDIKKINEQIAKKEAAIKKNISDADQFMEDIKKFEAFNWVSQALCVQHTEGRATVNDLNEDGTFVLDKENFRLTPEEILFDLNRSGEFAGYAKNWRYRTTRGAGMGKAIMPYSGASIGDLINGSAARWQTNQNPFLNMNQKEATDAFERAKKRVRQQNLVGGQRFQSTSDFRPEWGLDYIMSFLEMQALGSKVQMYTKVVEAVDFLGSIGADVNCSIMAKNNGYHVATEEEIALSNQDTDEGRELKSRMGFAKDEDGNTKLFVMDFSDVTGMDYNKAKQKSKKFNSVQMILVGMNDVHIKLALRNDDIDFVIPWHSSGNSKDVLQQLVHSVGEKLIESSDYTDSQTDQIKSHKEGKGKKAKTIDDRTEMEIARWNARMKILTGVADKAVNTEKPEEGGFGTVVIDGKEVSERELVYSDPWLSQLYDRFYKDGVDKDCYGVALPKEQAAQIFPYEYWDKNTTREDAYKNGQRFAEYCDRLGLVPRFNQFKNEPGYWKVLIDRKMYDNNVLNEDGTVKEYGKYREQQVVDVTKARIDNDPDNALDERKKMLYQLPEQTTAKYAKKNSGDYSAETSRAILSSDEYLSQKYDLTGSLSAYGDMTEADIQLMRDAQADYQSAMARGDTEAAQEDLDFIREEGGDDAALDAEYMEAVRTGNVEKQQQMVNARAEELRAEVFAATDVPTYSVRRGFKPKKTITVYKTFTLDEEGRPSALFVSSKNAIPVGVWLDAQDTFHFQSTKNGRLYVPSTKNPNTKGGATGTQIDLADISEADLQQLESLGHITRKPNGEYSAKSLTSLAYRPGWHAGDMPFFPQGGMKIEGSNYENVHRYNQAVFECEMAADKDYTTYDIRDDGTVAYHDMQEMPADGSYKFATNPMANAQDIGAWYISGALKINRALTEEECNEILAENGRAPQEWQQYQDSSELKRIKGKEGKYAYEHTIGPLDLDALGYDPSRTDAGKKLLDPVTYDDNGNVIPLSQRFNKNVEDARYSVGGEMTEADQELMRQQELNEALVKSGAVSQEDVDAYNGEQAAVPSGPQRQYGAVSAQKPSGLNQKVKDWLAAHSDRDVDTNDAQVDRAVEWMMGNASEYDPEGFWASLEQMEKGEVNTLTADGRAKLFTLASAAAALNNTAVEIRIHDMINRTATDVGRALQAQKLYRLMTPEGRMSVLQKEVDNINNELKNHGKEGNVTMDDWIMRAAAAAQTEEDFNKAREAAWKDLADKVPVTWKDRIQTWRMLSMLGNPRTHVRNILGNALFVPTVGLKNAIGTALESTFVKDGERTKAVRYSDEAKAFAAQDVEAMRDTLTGEAKYKPEDKIQQTKKVFGRGEGLLSRTVGKAVQGWSDFNSDMLEKEDWIFLNKHYQNALASYMTANNLTGKDMTGQTLQKARAYAVLEAQKATYRDANVISSWLNELSRKGGPWGVLVDAVLPFKKTPANILRRGVEYSPVGLLKSIAYAKHSLDLYAAWEANGKKGDMPKGAKSATQVIDGIASGLAGTAISAIGALLYSMGAVKLGFKKGDEDDDLEKESGSQEYSIELFGHSFTVDWAAPVCMPFFTGASLYKAIAERDENMTVGKFINSLSQISEPVFNLSMLDGVNSLLKTVSYSSDGIPVGEILQKVGANYVGSLLGPAFFGAVARTIDPVRRRAYTESGDDLSTWNLMLEQVQNKYPFLSMRNTPYRNMWGEEERSGYLEAFAENFLLPGYHNEIRSDALNDEMRRVRNAVGGEADVLPSAAGKKLGDMVLTDVQQDRYSMLRGQTANALMADLISRPEYLALTNDNPEGQAALIKSVWEYANAYARKEVQPDWPMKSIATWIKEGLSTGDPIGALFAKEEDNARKAAVSDYKVAVINGIANDDVDEIRTNIEGLKQAGQDNSTIRGWLTDNYKNAYVDAYQNGDEDEMERLRNSLMIIDLGKSSYKQSDFEKWLK